MVSIFGTDLTGAFDAIKGATSDLLGNLDLSGPRQPASAPARDPFAGLQLGGGDPFKGVGGGNTAFDRLQFGGDPFAGLGSLLGASNPQTGYSSLASFGYNPVFSAFDAASQKVAQKAQADQQARQPQTTGSTVGSTGATGGAVASSADNAALTPQQIDQWIAQTRPNSPLAGTGAFILQEANRQGVSVPQLLGIMLLESGLGTEQGTLPGVYNYGGLTGSGWAGQTGNTTGMARAFATFDSKEHGIAALIANLATPAYKGKTLQQQTALWYLGDPNAGLGSSDENQNATLQQYLDTIGTAYRGLGVSFDPQARPQQASAPGGGNYSGDYGGLFGDQTFDISQGFNAHEAGLADIYDFGNQFGMDGDGHTGIDIAAPDGTAFYLPKGLSGTVTIAGGSGYYNDETGRHNPATSGEIRIRLSNGAELILGHNSQINVRVGQQVNAGDLLGLTGTANGPHLHVEMRVPDRSTPSGWRIVDPTSLFAPTGGGGASYR